MTIHYHGTPITPRGELFKMYGENFCVSFANPSDADVCMKIGQSIMWDNGAFSYLKREGGLDPVKFRAWVEPKLGHPHWCVIPDVIDGDEATQRELVNRWELSPYLSAPVWHLSLSTDWLFELIDRFPKICFGSTSQYWQVGSEQWDRRVDYIFNEIYKRGNPPWIHMLRGLSICGERWPFASADSTNVARNFKNKGEEVCPVKMARRINSIQNPVKWETKETQKDLFND